MPGGPMMYLMMFFWDAVGMAVAVLCIWLYFRWEHAKLRAAHRSRGGTDTGRGRLRSEASSAQRAGARLEAHRTRTVIPGRW